MQHATTTTFAAGAIAALAMLAFPAAAADKELLDILLANGAITQAQYEELLDDEELTAEDVEVAIESGGLEVSDAEREFEIGGRLHLDFARHSGAGDLPVDPTDGSEVRRARIELAGAFDEDWGWVAQADFADNDVSLKDFALSYEGLGGVTLTVGHQKQPYSLAVEMSSNDLPFVERAIDNDLIISFVDRAIGVRADAAGSNWYASGGLFGESVSPGGSGDEGWAVVGRYVYAPILEADRVLHIGFRGARRYTADNDPVARMRDETTHFSSLRIVDTGVLDDVDSVTLLGPEAAWAKGRLSLTGEYNDASIDRKTNADLGFTSWHVAATWSLGQASRVDAYRISAGEFKGLRPATNFRRGAGGGTWELAARYASIDLNDGSFVGGSEDAFTVGANWYVNRNVRLLFDWTRILDTDESSAVRAGADGMNVLQIRGQYTF